MLNILKSKEAARASTANGTGHDVGEAVAGDTVWVPLRQIQDNPYQPRTAYDAEHILNLALSIKSMKSELPGTLGLQQVPMARMGMVQRDGQIILADRRMYTAGAAARALATKVRAVAQLMFGHSRLRAFLVLTEGLRALGDGSRMGLALGSVSELESRFAELLDADLDFAVMPLHLGFALDHAMWAHAVTENSQRKNITAIEEAQSIQRAIADFGLTAAEAGQPFGYARSTTANKLRLLQLPEEARQAIANGEMTERHGRELLRLVDDPERLAEVAKRSVAQGLTVRQLTREVDWWEHQIKDAQEEAVELEAARAALAAGWTLPGQTVPVPEELISTENSWRYRVFRQTDEQEQALIEQGHCGPEQCECFLIGWCGRAEHGYRPDPAGAPHMAAVCQEGLRNRRTEMDALGGHAETPEEKAEREERERQQRQVEQLNQQAHAVWLAWIKEQAPQTLWNNILVWREMAKHGAWLEDVIQGADNVQQACQEMMRLLYKRTRRYNAALNSEVHHPHEVRALIGRLSGEESEKQQEQMKGGDDDVRELE